MTPFKLKPELAESSELLFGVAEEVFGRFAYFSHSDTHSYGAWERSFQYETLRLTIQHHRGDDTFKAEYSVGWKNGIDVSHPLKPQGELSSWWVDLWQEFMRRAAKPWSEWTDEEIMSSTKWCRYFVEAGNVPSGTIHTMMVMKSFEDSDDLDIKGYFRACQRIPST